MNDIIVTVGTVTYAIKARKIFMRQGIQSKLVKINGAMTPNGCTHGIQINAVDFYHAIKILKESGIEYSVYFDKP